MSLFTLNTTSKSDLDSLNVNEISQKFSQIFHQKFKLRLHNFIRNGIIWHFRIFSRYFGSITKQNDYYQKIPAEFNCKLSFLYLYVIFYLIWVWLNKNLIFWYFWVLIWPMMVINVPAKFSIRILRLISFKMVHKNYIFSKINLLILVIQI